ncbi:MAG: hypothetical protein JW852_04860 [Spirochaetales bacterium]|nr:hypothetical protein [Spirochaetales bacterium]
MPPVSFSIIQSQGNISPAIRSGDTVVLEVLRELSAGKWRVSHNGRVMTIQSTVRLEPGKWIRTKAEITANRVLLHVAPERGQAPERTNGLFPRGVFDADKVKEMLVLAFRRAGLPIDTPVFKRSMEVFGGTRKKNSTTASVLSALAEKNISPDTGIVDYVLGLFEGFCDPDDGSSQRRNRNRKDEDDPVDVCSLARQLKEQVETPAGKDETLHLFNHLKGNRESWVLIPYALKQASRDVTGTLRLRVSDTGDIKKLAMDASTEGSVFTFSMPWPIDDKSVITVGCNETALLQEFVRRSEELPKKLRNLSSINDDNSIDRDRFDCLALEEVEPFAGVDKFA